MPKTNFQHGTIVEPAFLNSMYQTGGGHVHDGGAEDGHAPKINIAQHVTGVLPAANIGNHQHGGGTIGKINLETDVVGQLPAHNVGGYFGIPVWGGKLSLDASNADVTFYVYVTYSRFGEVVMVANLILLPTIASLPEGVISSHYSSGRWTDFPDMQFVFEGTPNFMPTPQPIFPTADLRLTGVFDVAIAQQAGNPLVRNLIHHPFRMTLYGGSSPKLAIALPDSLRGDSQSYLPYSLVGISSDYQSFSIPMAASLLPQ